MRILPESDHDYNDLPQSATANEREILIEIRSRVGSRNAIRHADLARRVGLSARRTRAIIRKLRVEFGLPILSSFDSEPGGYFWPESDEEFERYSSGLKAHGLSTLDTLRRSERMMEKKQVTATQPSLLSIEPSANGNCPRCAELARAGSKLICEGHR